MISAWLIGFVAARETTTIIGGAGDRKAIAGRVEQIRRDIKKTTSDTTARSSRNASPSFPGGSP